MSYISSREPLTKLYRFQVVSWPMQPGDEDKLCRLHMNQIHFQSVKVISS